MKRKIKEDIYFSEEYMSFNDCVPFIKEGTIVELISCSLNNTYSSGVEVEIAVPDSVRTVTICASFLTRAQE